VYKWPESSPQTKQCGTYYVRVHQTSEITASSTKSFEDAIQVGISRASKTQDNVQSAWIQDHEVGVEGGKISEYKVRMKITFVMKDWSSPVAERFRSSIEGGQTC